ncbi:BZIP domain-containing protein [Psidium guajava]|nr:BZIP domain-containing protein [Psidium guajava]
MASLFHKVTLQACQPSDTKIQWIKLQKKDYVIRAQLLKRVLRAEIQL